MMQLRETLAFEARAKELADRARSGEQIALRDVTGHGRSIAGILANLQGAVFVHVPDGLDQTERVILEVATALGPVVVKEVDRCLREEPEEPTASLALLDQALDGHLLIAGGWDRLGVRGETWDLSDALAPRSRSVQNWLAKRAAILTLGLGRAPAGASEVRWLTDQAPLSLHNGAEVPTGPLWKRLMPDASTYALALTLLALKGDGEEGLLDTMNRGMLPHVIAARLPDSVRGLLQRLALHGRPLDRSILEGVAELGGSTIETGLRLGLWHATPAGLVTEPAWCKHWRATLPGEARRRVHLGLAELFAREARPGDSESGRAGLAMLEAHRHFLAAGEASRARAFARYGAALLVEAARARSIKRDYAGAAELYQSVVDAADGKDLPVARKVCGYAHHYLHFNRARGGLEGLKETERGYRRALEGWPDNALFWSRLGRVLFYDDRPAVAMKVLAEAERKVPEHPRKQTVLVARTVRGLLRRGQDRLLDAVLVWGTYQPENEQAREVEDDLAERLRQGWLVPRLMVFAENPLFFNRPEQVQLQRSSAGWIAKMLSLQMSARGGSPVEAVVALVERIRGETRELLRAHTPDLDPEDRLRKQRLLGAVDVVASRVDAPMAETMWVFGDLSRDDQQRLWLHTGGSYDLRFEVPPEIARGQTVDDLPHFASVCVRDGVPAGPVVLLEPGLRNPEMDVWKAWRKRLSDAS